jgi:hypothetical protein
MVGVKNDAIIKTNAPNLRKYITVGEYTPKTSFALLDAHGVGKDSRGMSRHACPYRLLETEPGATQLFLFVF